MLKSVLLMTKRASASYANLEAYRKANGMTQEEAARKFRVTQSAWSNWERGRRRPAHRYIAKLVSATGVSLADLMGISS